MKFRRLSSSAKRMLQRMRGVSAALILSTRPEVKPVAGLRKPHWAVTVRQSQNLYQVTGTFFRSARPLRNHVELLRSLGIRNVVSLRAFHSNRSLLEQNDIKVIRIPVNTWNIQDKHVVAALRAIRNAENEGPVLLHCLHGADRTGLVTAMYRMVFQHWEKDQALDELLNGGYGFHSIWKNIPNYLRAVDVEKICLMVDSA